LAKDVKHITIQISTIVIIARTPYSHLSPYNKKAVVESGIQNCGLKTRSTFSRLQCEMCIFRCCNLSCCSNAYPFDTNFTSLVMVFIHVWPNSASLFWHYYTAKVRNKPLELTFESIRSSREGTLWVYNDHL